MRIVLVILVLWFSGINAQDTLTYAFFGHTYQWGSGGTRVDHRIEDMDLTQFDRIWLGGDICSEASLEYSTLAYLNNLFDLGKPGNHWTLGNHDSRNGNIEWIESFTKRPLYYAHYEKGITTVVLHGGISPLDCENLNAQYEMIKNVCDTISSGYLIFLVHHGLPKDIPGVADVESYAHSQLKHWLANCYSDTTNYKASIYPMLVEVENRGVEVMHITGDVGTYTKSFYGESDDGVEFFGSGINNSYNELNGIPITGEDLVLVFKHALATNTLTWQFIPLNDL